MLIITIESGFKPLASYKKEKIFISFKYTPKTPKILANKPMNGNKEDIKTLSLIFYKCLVIFLCRF